MSKKPSILHVGKVNWKSSLLGIITGLMVLLAAARTLLDDDPATNPDIGTVSEAITGITLIIWGIITRDGDKSSQDSGVR
jgi:hypothetical protein